MNAGAEALRAWRGDIAPAAAASRLAIGPMVYERIEAGEVIPEPWLRAVIEAESRGIIGPALWDGCSCPRLSIVDDDGEDPSVMIVRRSDGHWVKIQTREAFMSVPIDRARALSGKLAAMFGLVDQAMTAATTST